MSAILSPQKWLHTLAVLVVGLVLVMAASMARAATTSVEIGFDTDNNPATGCTLNIGTRSMPGVEVALATMVTTTANTGTVGAITRRTCTAGVFSAPVVVSSGGWSVGMTTGLSGSDLIETFIPLADLAVARAVKIGAMTPSDSLIATNLLNLGESPVAVSIPALSPMGLLILLVLICGTGWLMHNYRRQGGQLLLMLCVAAGALTTASALAIVLDGNGADWIGIAPLATGAKGDAPAGQDLVALYAVKDGANLALRIDMVLERELVNQAPVVNAGANQTITLPAAAALLGTATDDGLPNPPAHLATTWSFVSGPSSGVVFGNPASLNTSATFAAPGTYTLRLTASDSALSASSDMQVTVNDSAPLFMAIPDRTIALGTRYQQLLVASDANVGDRLTYSLLAAPGGAALSPSPLVDWTPTAAQLGLNTFTAKVTDSASHTAQTTFHVTVVHTNQPPQLAPQPNVILPVGTAFTRMLQATDPDAGDVLTFALGTTHPAGMTLTGAVLNWPTTGKAPGDYAVTVRVTDAGSLFDEKTFTVTLTQAAPAPVAKDDSYEVRLNQTLTIPAVGVLGVLGNDLSLSGSPLTAVKLSNPDKGTLNAFNADGSFNYTAPATLPPAPGLNPVVSWREVAEQNNQFALAADVDHDGIVDYVTSDFGAFRARRGSDGLQLWQWDRSITTHADLSGCGTAGDQFALGNISDVAGGDIYLFSSINCDQGGYAGFPDRYFAVNASQVLTGGKVATQWLSERLSRPHPGAYATATSSAPADPPVTPFFGASADGSVPTLAKLTEGGSTKLLSRFLATDVYGPYFYKPNSSDYARAACRTLTGLPADEGRPCKATYVIDAATGAIDHVLTAPNAANQMFTYNSTPTKQNVPIVADLDGDGQVEIISGGDVWKLVDGVWTLAWQAQFDSVTPGEKLGFEPTSVAVADLDGDGKAEVIIHIIGYDNGPQKNAGGIHIFNHDGTLRRTIPIPFTWINGLLSVADVDGDGAPEILLSGDSFVYAYRQDGTLLWAKLLPDITSDIVPALAPIGNTPHTTDSPLYVYDLDLDGVPEVIIQGTRRLFILNGRTGAELWSIDTESDGYYLHGNPLLVDADGDGHVDIIVHGDERWNCGYWGSGPGGCRGNAMRISGGDHNWAPGPKVQNQLNFRPTAINDAAQILYDSSVRRDFRQQIQQGTVIDPRIAQSTSFTYKANDGIADSAPATVRIDIKPPNRPPVITSTPPTALFRVYPDGVKTIYTITAVDPDPGDTVHYELVSSNFDTTYFPGPTVDSATGNVGLYSCVACGSARVVITVAAVDTQGARAEQSFIIDLSRVAVAVPNVIGQLLPDARTAIETASLIPLVVTELFGPQPAGTVIGQDPLAGTVDVGRSATVKLTVSKGPQPYTMPFVVGQQLAPTNALLTSVGLSVNVASVTSLTIPAGEIMSQTPAAGTVLQPASAAPVALTVSVGGPLPMPIASIVLEPGPGPFLRLAGDELQYKAIAILTDGTSADITLSAVWASSLTGVATVNTVGIAKAITNGTTTISATRDGKTGQGTLNVASRVLGDNTPPTAAITSPADGGAVTGQTLIVGTASDTNFLRYELAYAVAGDENYTLIAEGTTAVTNGTLGMLDPTGLINDLYTLRLTVFDRSENESVATRTVQLSGGRKIGLFTLTFQDLGIAMSGLPITVVRTYDSRDKKQGDFGVGWQQGFNTMRLRTNRVPGTGWVRNVAGAFVNLAPTAEHKVSLTLPDGRVQEFDMIVSPTSNIGSLDFTNVTGYQPRAGTQGQLQALGNNSLLIVNVGAQVELVDDTTLKTFEPPLYRYTAQDGTQFEIHITDGVKKITDRNGNNVSFGPGGIIHSAGKSVIFARDMKGRITQISDPMGNVQTYSYDGNGDLASHTDATGNTTRFFYDRHHDLIRIVDPLGRVVARNDYDGNGRLIATTDAAGNQITYTHDIGASTELVRDRLGNPTLYAYDAMGNVVAKTDPLGHVTAYTYDSRGNMLSETNPLGHTNLFVYDANNNLTSQTDPLGNTHSNTYNSSGQLLTVTDPLGRTSTNTYDANGNRLTETDPLGNTTLIVYDPAGNPLALTDPVGKVFQSEYDATGSRTKLTRPGGNVFAFSYDANGNLLAQANALSPAWNLSYDPKNRLTGSVTGSATRAVAFDAAGQTTGVTTSTGQQVQLAYNPMGRLTDFIRSEGTISLGRTFDTEGNVLTQTDPVGNVTSYTYDAAMRRIATTFPDSSMETRAYDAAGQVGQLTDQLGHSTTYQYNAAGWQIQSVNALGGVTRKTYDAVGNVVARTDALGHTTQYAYDLANRLITTTFPDGATQQRNYDGAGQLRQVVDPAGHATSFTYYDSGALAVVTDALGNTTQYEYDTAGKRTAIVDANGNRTAFAYDSQGRLNKTTYPLGDSQSAIYDIAGRVVASINGNAQTLLYAYDTRGQLSSLTLPTGTTETFSYTDDGLTAAVVDARGTMQNQYDPVSRRLTRVSEPDGRYVRYAYDAAGNRTLTAHAMSSAGPEEVTLYTYDALNRLENVTDPKGGITHYTYNAVGNQAAIGRPNGTTTAFTYDSRNRLIAEVHKKSDGTTLASFTYTRDAAGNRTMVQHSDGSRIEYDYDATNKVTAERRFNAGNVLTGSVAYNYDAVGNLLSSPGAPGNPTFTYNANNQVTSGNGATYAYDGAGNMVSATSGASVTGYAYDPRGRLTRFQPPVGAATTYTYDFRGLRQSKSGTAGTINFLTDRANGTGFPQVVRESNAAGTTLRSYNFGTELLARSEGASVLYYHADGLGSTRLLTDSTGAPADTYTYSANGQLLAGGATANAYQFAGEQQDAESGLYYLRARYYSPGIGRFISRDPATGNDQTPLSLHKYLYANGNPTNMTDPGGRETLIELEETQADMGMWMKQAVPRFKKALDNAQKLFGSVELGTAAYLSVGALVESMFGTTMYADAFLGQRTRWLGYIGLAGILEEMGRRNTTFVYPAVSTKKKEPEQVTAFVLTPGGLGGTIPGFKAPDAIVYLTLKFMTLPPLPTPFSVAFGFSMPGTLVHEFAHIAWDLNDSVYSCTLVSLVTNPQKAKGLLKATVVPLMGGTLDVQPGDTWDSALLDFGTGMLGLLVPESYRCFVESTFVGVGLDALNATGQNPPPH